MENFSLVIITPESKLFDGKCIQVNIPAFEGAMGILAKHMNYIVALKTGLVEIIKPDKSRFRIVINGGLMEMKENKCSILIEKGIDIDNTDLDSIGKRLADLNEKILSVKETEKEMLKMEISYLNEVMSHFALSV